MANQAIVNVCLITLTSVAAMQGLFPTPSQWERVYAGLLVILTFAAGLYFSLADLK